MEVDTARIMLYQHRELQEGITLEKLADDLIEYLCQMCVDCKKARPISFVRHGIVGLVAKRVLAKARQDERLRWIVFNFHGATFFGKFLA